MNQSTKIATYGYQDLDVWKRSSKLCVSVIQAFRKSRDFELKKQIIRSALSIPSNISEGYERRTKKELINFLGYAKGSAGELRTQIKIAGQSSSIPRDTAEKLFQEATEINSMLQGLLNYHLEPNQGNKS